MYSESKYRAKLVKGKKGWLVKGLMFSTLLFGSFLIDTTITHASEWQPNSVESIKAKLQDGQNSYTFEEGDTFYNIGLEVNVKWQTLMEINGFSEGSQYTVPVGTTIIFDGAKITVTDPSGQIVNEKFLTTDDKIDPTRSFADQKSDVPRTGISSSNTYQPNSGSAINEQANDSSMNQSPQQKPNDPTISNDIQKAKEQAEKEKQEAEKAKEQAEKEKQAAEKAKQEAERRLTEALNVENDNTLADLQAKRDAAVQNVTNAQATYDAEAAKLPAIDSQAVAAQADQANAQAAVAQAQSAVTAAQTGINEVSARITTIQGQIQALQAQATESGDDAAMTQLTALQGQLAAAQGELDTYNGQLASAQGELNNASGRLQAANDVLANAMTQKAAIEAAILNAKNALTAAQNELNSLPTDVSALTSDEAKRIQAELAQWNKRIAELDNQIAALDDQIINLSNQIKLLDEQLANTSNDFKQVETDAKNAEAAIADDTVVDNANTTATGVENNMPQVKPAPVNEDRYETIYVDEVGNVISDTTGYIKISEEQLEPVIETLENGDTITTHTTKVVYHKIVNTDKFEVIAVDTLGNMLSDTTGYIKVSEEDLAPVIETLPNGDTVTTYTKQETYRKLENMERHDVVNVDEEGNVLNDLTGYVKVLESDPVITTETLPNGDTITIYTITVVYHLVVNEDKFVIINVDENGIALSDLAGYVKVSEENLDPVVETLANGDTVTTYTTRIIYHKVANEDKFVTINVDEAGNVLSSLDGYVKVSESEPVKTVKTLANGDTVTTYTTTVTYHKVINEDKFVTVNVDEAGNTLTDLTGYEKVSESEPVKTVETVANGDTVTTYTTTVTYKKIQKDEVIENIKPATDDVITQIKDQVQRDDTGVSIEQADQLTDVNFAKNVADQFINLVHEEQDQYGESKVNLTQDDAAYREIASRAVEVMYNFSHNTPSNTLPDGTYTIDREKGSQELMFNTENIAKFTISKARVQEDSTILARLIAETMFEQFIANERDSYRNGGSGQYMHYQNIIASGYSDMALSVFMVDNGGYYTISVAVTTGNTATVR